MQFVMTPGAVLASAGDKADFVDLDVPLWAWGALVAVIVVLLVVDLLLVHRTPHDITFKEAAIESAVWITIGVAFTASCSAVWQGGQAAGEYISGYLIEKSLSIDNVFVWAVIFSYFAVPAKYQFRVLFWGIFGALVLRAIFIFAGVGADRDASTGSSTCSAPSCSSRRSSSPGTTRREIHPENNPVLEAGATGRPVTAELRRPEAVHPKNDRSRLATPLFAVLVFVETTDVVFAVDSIPAILAVSPRAVHRVRSNAFAILGLRALYFLLAGMQDRFRYLNQGLGVILAFVGVKMLLLDVVHLPTWASLSVIVLVLAATVALSLRAERQDQVGSKSTQ